MFPVLSVPVKFIRANPQIRFVIGSWLLSRLLIVNVLLIVGLPTIAKRGISAFDIFAAWDGEWYQQIATIGYSFALDGKLHSVPFFPLYPTLAHLLMQLGLPFAIAGILVNNLAFLAALWVVYDWLQERYSVKLARSTIAVLVCCPLSLFCSVTYTEGLFLLVTSLALRSFDRSQYGATMFWGALSTATRLTGIILIPTFLGVAWQERRSKLAVLSAIVTALGLVLYSLYCFWKFGEPLAFLKAQAAFGHRSSVGIDLRRWGLNFVYGVLGPIKANGMPKNLWHPVQFFLITGLGYLTWQVRSRLNTIAQIAIPLILLVWFWLLWGDGWIKTMMVFGGAYLLWRSRRELAPVILHYGFWSLLLVMVSGSITSAERYAFGSVAISIAFGAFLAKYPHWAVVWLSYFVIVLITVTGRFAQGGWVA